MTELFVGEGQTKRRETKREMRDEDREKERE